jgi:hypothetical protein
MAVLNRLDAVRAPKSASKHDHHAGAGNAVDFNDFEAELKRLSDVNQELLDGVQADDAPLGLRADAAPVEESDELLLLRLENAELKARIEELEAAAAGQGEELWLERQREYEMLLEDKTDVIRNLHQKIQELQESHAAGESPAAGGNNTGHAEEILRLKRDLEEQRRQLEQDEEDMVTQMRQMEMAMAKDRAEMARQRNQVQRLQADLAREIENSERDPELRERLHSLRRSQDAKPAAAPADKPAPAPDQNSSGFFRRIFG